MNETPGGQPPTELPDPNQPPAAAPRAPVDKTGWAQPPAPQSPGPPGAFVDRPAAPPTPPLPPGAGSPLVPGTPMSVSGPISDKAINLTAVLLAVGIGLVVIIVVAILLAAFHPFGR